MKRFMPVMIVVCLVAVAAFAARYEELIVTKLQVLSSAVLPTGSTVNGKTPMLSESATLNYAMEKGGATSVLATTVTQSLVNTYIDVPVVTVVSSTGTLVTNVLAVASNQFTITYGATNMTYRYSAIGRVM